MSTIDASKLLRANLLDGVSVMLARAPQPQPAGESLATAIHSACCALGARVSGHEQSVGGEFAEQEAAMDEAVLRTLAATGSIDLLVVDGAGLFAHAGAQVPEGEGPGMALRTCLEASWNATRAVVSHAFLAREHGGRIVYLAPAPDAGEHADAARAGLENLARTLSIEWARHGITTAAIAPRGATAEAADEVAALTAYLASPAGAYFSGCLLDLRGVAGGA